MVFMLKVQFMVRFCLISIFCLGFFSVLSGQTLTRKEFQNLEESGKRTFFKSPTSEISDLVNGNEELAKDGNKALISIESFKSLPYEKKIAILNNPEHYIIMPANWKPAKIKVRESDLWGMSPEKRENIKRYK